MYYDAEKIIEICDKILELYNIYNDYYYFKKNMNLNNVDEIIWCKGWKEPFHIDYISEISDNSIEIRKILKKKPSKKDYNSEHYFMKKIPIYSVFYGENGEVVYEKFYMFKNNELLEISFLTDKKDIYNITIEKYDSQNRPFEYTFMGFYGNYRDKIISRTYWYNENNCIIKSEAISEFNIKKPIILYNDNRYQNIGIILTQNIGKMNPQNVEQYIFNYNIDGIPEFYTRVDFSYGDKFTNTWKIKKSLLKKYWEYGITFFMNQKNKML